MLFDVHLIADRREFGLFLFCARPLDRTVWLSKGRGRPPRQREERDIRRLLESLLLWLADEFLVLMNACFPLLDSPLFASPSFLPDLFYESSWVPFLGLVAGLSAQAVRSFSPHHIVPRRKPLNFWVHYSPFSVSRSGFRYPARPASEGKVRRSYSSVAGHFGKINCFVRRRDIDLCTVSTGSDFFYFTILRSPAEAPASGDDQPLPHELRSSWELFFIFCGVFLPFAQMSVSR